MSTEVSTESIAELDRLRDATGDYSSAGGLAWVVNGTIFLWIPLNEAISIPFWMMAFIGVAGIAAVHYVPRYYERRFGRVERKVPSNLAVFLFLLFFVIQIFFGHRISHYVDHLSQKVHLALSDPQHLADLGPITFWLVWVVASFRWRHRRNVLPQLVFAVLGFLFWGILAMWPLSHPEVRQNIVWKFLNDGALGITLIAFGLYQHIRFLNLLPPRTKENGNE